MRILVINRQAEIVPKIKMILKHRDPFIQYHRAGLDGLLAARRVLFDLIICGEDLPVITGFEVIRSVRLMSLNKVTRVVALMENPAPGKLVGKLCEDLKIHSLFPESELEQRLPQIAVDVG